MVARDLGGIAVGLGGIVFQLVTVPPDHQNEMVLLILALVAGIPGASQLVSIVRNGTPIVSQSSSSPPEVLPLPESPSSSGN